MFNEPVNAEPPDNRVWRVDFRTRAIKVSRGPITVYMSGTGTLQTGRNRGLRDSRRGNSCKRLPHNFRRGLPRERPVLRTVCDLYFQARFGRPRSGTGLPERSRSQSAHRPRGRRLGDSPLTPVPEKAWAWVTRRHPRPAGLALTWLGDRDSNPDSTVQSRMSYRWTISQRSDGERPV